MILALKQCPGIYLTGFMASGKTTVGQVLAQRIGWRFADLDYDIESEWQTTIASIFQERGETEFRRIETQAVRKRILSIRCGTPTILALGGGTYAQPENAEILDSHGVSLWLDCPFDVVCRRVQENTARPLARDPELFRNLYLSRQAAYARAAYRIPVTEEAADQVVNRILELPLFHQ